MALAALIMSTIAVIGFVITISLMLAKNFFSTHTIQREMVDPFKETGISSEIGKLFGKEFRDLGDPIDADELEHLENLRKKRKP